MKFIEPIGEQKIECKECQIDLLKLTEKYSQGIFCGAALKLCATVFVAKDNPKEWFMETCSNIFDFQVESYRNYEKSLENDEIDKKSEQV